MKEVQPQAHSLEIQTELSRDLGLTSALAIGVGTMIAAGIFTLSGLAIRNVGSAAIVSFLLAAAVATFTALTYCEFASIYPRSGEGYLYARRTFIPPLAYFVGWTLFLGYTSSCAFYLDSLSSYFSEFIWKTPLESLSGLFALAGLTLLNLKGTKESGTFQVVVTAGKIILLGWFVGAGFGSVTADQVIDRFNTDFLKIGGTAGMVFITFFGFSAIAASAGEVKNPTKTVPRAIFISMGVVTVLYTLVVLVLIAARLTEYSEAAMGAAARQFLGPIGGMIIIGGAIFSMISASNASIMAGSRVVFSMGRLRHLPAVFGTVNKRTRTPGPAVLAIGIVILIFILLLPLEDLAHFADTVLLLALIMVNAALIMHRAKYPEMERPFRVPLVPLTPALGIVANLYLLFQIRHHLFPIALSGACLLIGIAGFIVWRGTQPEEEALPGLRSRLAVERYAVREGRFRILVPLANPATVDRLMELAATVAAPQDGEIVALRVAVIPEQLPPYREDQYVERERKLLETAHADAQRHGVPVTSLVRVGHNAARAILETARERDCDLIIMGWKGYSTTTQRILGEMVEDVMSLARADVILAKLVPGDSFRKFLLYNTDEENSRCAEKYAKLFVPGRQGSLTVCGFARLNASEETKRETEKRLEESVERLGEKEGLRAEPKLIRNTSVLKAVLRESRQHDALIMGASADRGVLSTFFPQGLPEVIARKSKGSVLLVKRYRPVHALLSRIMKD